MIRKQRTIQLLLVAIVVLLGLNLMTLDSRVGAAQSIQGDWEYATFFDKENLAIWQTEEGALLGNTFHPWRQSQELPPGPEGWERMGLTRENRKEMLRDANMIIEIYRQLGGREDLDPYSSGVYVVLSHAASLGWEVCGFDQGERTNRIYILKRRRR